MHQENLQTVDTQQDVPPLLESVQRVREAMARVVEEDAFGELARGILQHW